MHQAFNFAFLATHWDAAALRTVVEASLPRVGRRRRPDHLGAVQPRRRPARLAARSGRARARARTASAHGDEQPDEALGLRRARCASLLMLGLPGSAYLYQGEELGLPDHTSLDDDLRQDPAFFRTGGAERGRDGCRVPLPWARPSEGFGFSPTGVTWLPQPAAWASYALDAQRGVAGSTYETYRSALQLRRESGLGSGGMEWLHGLGDDVIAFVNRDVLVVANLGAEPVALPAGRRGAAGVDRPVGERGRHRPGAVGRHGLGALHRVSPDRTAPPSRRGRSSFTGARTRPTPAPSAAAR